MNVNQLFERLNQERRKRGEVEMSREEFRETLAGLITKRCVKVTGTDVSPNCPILAASPRPGPGCLGYIFN
jgi:hypothetical protein